MLAIKDQEKMKAKTKQLYRVDNKNNVIVNDGKLETVLDYLREISWE